jgi:5-methylcytosine-specific restriction endonuclease McrA
MPRGLILGKIKSVIEMEKRHKRISDFKNKISNGFVLCLNCEKPITNKRRKRYCSENCADEFTSRHLSQAAFKDLIIRKRGKKCEKCGKEVEYESELIFDHIVPIALGGEVFDEKNVQLLCEKCNTIKTKNDLKKIMKKIMLLRSKKKKEEKIKELSKTFKTLDKFI